MTDGAVLLSCEQCKKRKTKCDKSFPRCSACRLANISCHPVQRSRLPRGRTGNIKQKNNALADKIARLEDLVGRLETQIVEREVPTSASDPSNGDSNPDSSKSADKIEDLVARDFWTALSREVVGLRETLETNDGEDNHQPDKTQSHLPCEPPLASSCLLFNENGEPLALRSAYVKQPMRATLIHLYRERVDILFKVTHWPTVMNMLQRGDHSNITSRSNMTSIALEWSLCFTAATTLSEEDCEENCLGPKARLVEHCRAAAEKSLSQSNFLIEPSFHSLQAFTIYLMGLRTSGHGALTWTLLALAVRLATAIDLGSETNNKLSALDIEQRRRLWFGIGLLDSQAAFGRGSPPMLAYTDLKHPPLNINDNEIGVRTVSAHQSSEMFFSCLTHQGLVCQRKVCDPTINDPQARTEVVTLFESVMRNTYGHLEFSRVPIERYTALLARDMSINLQLVLRRPPYKFVPGNGITNQHVRSHADTSSFDVLQATTAILERGLAKQHSPEFAKWSWFSWPRWYALAILLVELSCAHVQMQRDSSTGTYSRGSLDGAYEVAIQSFKNYAQSAAEISTGTIWQPIVKLMRHLRTLRNDTTPLNLDLYPGSSPTSSSARPVQKDSQSQNQNPPNERTIMARFNEALADYNDATTISQSVPETNPDLLWGAFLEDLDDTTATEVALDSSVNIFSSRYSHQIPKASEPDLPTPQTESDWSVNSFMPIYKRIMTKDGEQDLTGGGQVSTSGQKADNSKTRLTLMANGQEGRSVVGRVFDFM